MVAKVNLRNKQSKAIRFALGQKKMNCFSGYFFEKQMHINVTYVLVGYKKTVFLLHTFHLRPV